ncbi:MAG: class I SAM-dependent methyltransferase [candidate division Zixibacteria bacterium]|nr:class I SAM-dependent methyltransferase [candidate division Zixibacteria bacterium]
MVIQKGYYDKKLSAEKLKRVYDIAPPRVKQYLQAEIDHVLARVRKSDNVLDLGCGYGRTLEALSERSKAVWGVDTSIDSLKQASESLESLVNCHLAQMNAVSLGFGDKQFDLTICIQNGISAFKVDQLELIKECLRVTKPGGRALFSTYSEKFWADRLEWFEIQAANGLLGRIDYDRTGNGIIVCEDGFKATTIGPDRFKSLISGLNMKSQIIEVDNSSLFCEILVE